MLGGQSTGMTGPGDNREVPSNLKKQNHALASDDPFALRYQREGVKRLPWNTLTQEAKASILKFGNMFRLQPISVYNDRIVYKAVMDGPTRPAYTHSTGKLLSGFGEVMQELLPEGGDSIHRTSDIVTVRAKGLEKFVDAVGGPASYTDYRKPSDRGINHMKVREQRFANPYQKGIGYNRVGDQVRILCSDSEAFQRVGEVAGYDFSNEARPLVVRFAKPCIQHGPGDVRDYENYSTDELELVRRAIIGSEEYKYRAFGVLLNEETSATIDGLSVGNDLLVMKMGRHCVHFQPHGVPYDAMELMRRFEKMLAKSGRKDALAWLKQNAVAVGTDYSPKVEGVRQAILKRAKGAPISDILDGLLSTAV